MIKHVLLIHSAIGKNWCVRIMWFNDAGNKVDLPFDSYVFDCEFDDEDTARKVANSLASSLNVSMVESE